MIQSFANGCKSGFKNVFSHPLSYSYANDRKDRQCTRLARYFVFAASALSLLVLLTSLINFDFFIAMFCAAFVVITNTEYIDSLTSK